MIKKVIDRYMRFMAWLTGYAAARNPLSPVFLTRSFMLKRIKESQPYFSGIVIDVGCGRKHYEEIISQTARYFGFDYPPMAPDTTGIKKNISPDIFGSGFALPIRSGNVDCIVNTLVLEYVPDPELFIGEFNRVLKPGGAVVMTVPFTYPVHHVTHDFFRFTEAGITCLLKKNGLEIVWIKANGGFWVVLGQLILYFINFRFLYRPHHDICWIFLSALRFLLTPMLLVVNCIVNAGALFCNLINSEPYITLNYSLVAKKKEQ